MELFFILSDITCRRIETVSEPLSAGAVGVAITVCAGLKGEDPRDLAKKLIKVEHTYIPDPETAESYRRNYEVFKKLYRSNKRNFRYLNT